MAWKVKRLAAIAVIAAALGALFAVSDADARAPASAAVWGVESSHRIEFPHRIVFDLQARAPDARSVRLYYRVGDSRSRVYLYPSAFSNAGKLRAQFSARSGGGRFIPQGVDIEYYYAFAHADGTETESARFSFEYLDPRYDWRRMEFADFDLLWHDRDIRTVRRVGATASARLSRAKDLFGMDGDYRFKAVIVNDRAEANRSFPAVSRTSRDVFLYGGFAFGDYGALILAGLYADGLTHELVHLLLDEAVDSPRARVPAWLNEGLAMRFERAPASSRSELRTALRRGRLIPISRMNAVPGRPNDVRLFYAQSASVVRYMLDAYGDGAMRALLARINAGDSIAAALQSAYGVSVDGLESRWRRSLAAVRAEDVSSAPSSPAVAASAVMGGAALASGAIAAARWAKRRTRQDEQPPT